jgi:hypothetical protein
MYVVYSSALAFQPTNTDGTSAGDEEVVKRGDPVPGYVLPFQINALASAGMIVEVGDNRDHGIQPVEAEPFPPVSADNPPGPIPALGSLTGDPETPAAPAEPVEKPKPNDSRAAWEAYGVSIGMDQLELEAEPNKAAVIDAVNARDNS